MNDLLLPVSLGVLVFILSFIWRLFPLLGRPHSGCDAYYFLIAREAMRHRFGLRIRIPGLYVLEHEEQWYPPGFTMFLALLPDVVIDRYYWAVSPCIDALINAFLFFLMLALGATPATATAAAAVYLFSFASINETRQLTSRQFGAFLFICTVVAAVLWANGNGWGFLVAALATGCMLLLSHRFGTQAFLLGLLGLWAVTGNTDYPVVVASAMGLALLVSRGFYLRILQSHTDHIRFWTTRGLHLGAHIVFNSPHYADPARRQVTHYEGGWAKTRSQLRTFFLNNAYLVMSVALLATMGEGDGAVADLAWISCILFVIGAMVYVIPLLRGIGMGEQWGKYSLPCAVLCIPVALQGDASGLAAWAVIGYSLYRGGRYLVYSIRDSAGGASTHAAWDIDSLKGVFAFIGELDDPLIFTVPLSYSDLIAYHCRVRVYWGGHHSPPWNWGHILPFLTERIEEFIARDGITHLLLDTSYARPEDLGITAAPVFSEGSIQIYDAQELVP